MLSLIYIRKISSMLFTKDYFVMNAGCFGITQYVINIWTKMISCRISASDIVNGRTILVISTGQSCFLNFHILAEFVFIAFLVENFFEAIDYKIFNSNLKKQDNCLDNIIGTANGISKQ